ncbi:MAG: molybdopterin-dependent oxidoreductase [Anaerolineae bacterium]
MEQLVTIRIDGQDVAVPPGTTVLDAARRIGIEIPSLCYHEKLLPAGLCRLCLVEIEKMRGLQPACATTVRDGMVVHTDTAPVLHNRRMVLELLCTNHPLDCPVCDAAGDCRLQDYVFRYGRTDSRFIEPKRHKGKAIPLGPAVMLDQERCVLCQRCVRFGEEVLDDRQLAVFQRGAASRIGAFPGGAFDSPFSGNAAELCPVGALTDRIARFRARAWELKSTQSACSLCPVGCKIAMETRGGRLVRVRSVGLDVPGVGGWLCDLGRTGYGFLEHDERLRQPLVRRDGRLEPATWDEALGRVAEAIDRVVRESGADAFAALGSPRLTNEAAYLLSKFARVAIGTNNVACSPVQHLAPAQARPSDVANADCLLLYLGDPIEEAPIVELWIKQALRMGARLMVVHNHTIGLARRAHLSVLARPGSEALFLSVVLSEVGRSDASRVSEECWGLLGNLAPAQAASLIGCAPAASRQVADALLQAEHAVLLYGCGVGGPNDLALLQALATATGARLLGWSSGANGRGTADMGMCPDRLPGQGEVDSAAIRARCKGVWGVSAPRGAGLGPAALWPAVSAGRVRLLYIVGVDVFREVSEASAAADAAEKAELVVVQDAFLSATAAAADVVLPAAAPGEEEGTMTTLAGQLECLQAAVAPPGEARLHWAIIAELARRLGAQGQWDYASAQEVLAEAGLVVPTYGAVCGDGRWQGGDVRYDSDTRRLEAPAVKPRRGQGDLTLVTGPVLFDRDALAGRSAIAGRASDPCAWIHPSDAAARGISDGEAIIVSGDGELRLSARVTEDCPAGVLYVPEQLGPDNVHVLGTQDGAVLMVRVKPAMVE